MYQAVRCMKSSEKSFRIIITLTREKGIELSGGGTETIEQYIQMGNGHNGGCE